MTHNIGDVPVVDLGAAIAAVADRVSRSVAEVRTRGHGGGAGVVWDASGLIVTNHHVAPGDQADVVLADGRSFAGAVIARDAQNDLAVIEVDGSDLPAIAIGDARSLRAGEMVIAVGHPFGIRAAVTSGIVCTALPRTTGRGERELIQADILLGPGNSGGPLTDARGRVVGINAMVNGRLAYAVPGHLADRLIATRRAPVIGIQALEVDLSEGLAAAAGVAQRRAVLVSGVAEGSPADAAGILIGDLIVGAGGAAVEGLDDLRSALGARVQPRLKLAVIRGGRPAEILLPRPEPDSRAA